MGFLQLLEAFERGANRLVFTDRSVPVLFQPQNPIGNRFRIGRTEEAACVLDQNRPGSLLRIPTERTPEHLVHVVLATIGVAEEPDGAGSCLSKNLAIE